MPERASRSSRRSRTWVGATPDNPSGALVGRRTDRNQTRYAVSGSGLRQLAVGLGVQLRLDDLQRQVLVALRGQDEPQARAVVGGEPPISRRGALRGDQALGFQEPDLGDGHVREVASQQIEDRSDRHPGQVSGRRAVSSALRASAHRLAARAAVVVALGPVRNTRRNLPICTSSPLASTAESTGSRLT